MIKAYKCVPVVQELHCDDCEAKEMAKSSDLMIVVGSKKSANTTHLAEILKDITSSIHIENDTELDSNFDYINL